MPPVIRSTVKRVTAWRWFAVCLVKMFFQFHPTFSCCRQGRVCNQILQVGCNHSVGFMLCSDPTFPVCQPFLRNGVQSFEFGSLRLTKELPWSNQRAQKREGMKLPRSNKPSPIHCITHCLKPGADFSLCKPPSVNAGAMLSMTDACVLL